MKWIQYLLPIHNLIKKEFCAPQLEIYLNDECLVKKVKFLASVMVCDCISGKGVGKLCLIDGTVNTQKFRDILELSLILVIEQCNTEEGNFIVQHEGSSSVFLGTQSEILDCG